MTDQPSAKDAAQLLLQLSRARDKAHQEVAGGQLDPAMALLRAWQSERLARTHADLLASQRFGPACRFFLTDIYAPRDFSQRDYDAKRLHDFMAKFLPSLVMRPLTVAVELNLFTRELDQALLAVLVSQLGLTDTLTEAMYAEAYRLCDNYADRVRQIGLIVEVGRGVERIAGLPFIGTTLRLARRPAHRAGWQELQSFLERGLAAFKIMGSATQFLNTISGREKTILDQIYAGQPAPFTLD